MCVLSTRVSCLSIPYLSGYTSSKFDLIGFLLKLPELYCHDEGEWVISVCYSRRAVVCPIIDVISDETFEYMAGSDMTYGGFNWKLNFRWYPVPQREMDRRKGDRTLPVRYIKVSAQFIFV